MVAQSNVYERTLNPLNAHTRSQNGALRSLAYVVGSVPATFVVPGIVVDFTLNNIITGGVPLTVNVDGGATQFVLTQIVSDTVNVKPNAARFLVLRFALEGIIVTDWLAPTPERSYPVAVAAPSVEVGFFPGIVPTVYTLNFDRIDFAMIGGAANLEVQGIIATGDARIDANMIGAI